MSLSDAQACALILRVARLLREADPNEPEIAIELHDIARHLEAIAGRFAPVGGAADDEVKEV